MKLIFISSALLAFVTTSFAQDIVSETTTSEVSSSVEPTPVAVETTQTNDPSTFHGTLFSTPTSSIKLILPPILVPPKATSTSSTSTSITIVSALLAPSIESTPATPPTTELPASPAETTPIVTAPLTTITPSSVCRLPSAIDKRLIASEVSTNSTRTSGRVATGRSFVWVPSTTSTTSAILLATSTPISTTSLPSSTLETSFITTSLEITASATLEYTTLSTSVATSTSTALDPCAEALLKPRGRFMRRN